MNKSLLNYDRASDILYIVIREGDEHHFVETADGIIVEFDEANQPVGIEISNASEVIAAAMAGSGLALVPA